MGTLISAMATSHAFAMMDPSTWDDFRERNRLSYKRRYGVLPAVNPLVATETSESIAQRLNVPMAKRLTAVIYDTARWANANHDASAVIMAKYTKLDVDRIRSMNRTRYATALDLRLIQPVLGLGFTYGGLPRHVNAAEVVDRAHLAPS